MGNANAHPKLTPEEIEAEFAKYEKDIAEAEAKGVAKAAEDAAAIAKLIGQPFGGVISDKEAEEEFEALAIELAEES